MRKNVRRIAVIDSIHCGSLYGLLPPGMKNSAGAEVELNPGQKYLWECYMDYRDWIRRNGGADALVVLGDVVDGEQSRQRGSEKCLTTISEQIQAAEQCIKALGIRSVYIIQGTEYHDDVAARSVEDLAARLRARRYEGTGVGFYTHEVLDMKIYNTVINFAHHGPGVVGLYRATGADKEGIFSALAGREGKAQHADVVVRGHWHFFVHVEHESKHVVYCPCWQLQTRYMRKRSYYRMLPDIGGLVIEITGHTENDPVRIIKRLYGLPAVTPQMLRR